MWKRQWNSERVGGVEPALLLPADQPKTVSMPPTATGRAYQDRPSLVLRRILKISHFDAHLVEAAEEGQGTKVTSAIC